MKFVKMHGIGNDFIIVDGFKEKVPKDLKNTSIKLCDRHFGIGADGLVFALPSDKADIRMMIYNSDGSEAEMCGNAIRCFAKFVYEQGYINKQEFGVETLAGIMVPRLVIEDGAILAVTVDMGEPSLERSSIPMTGPEGKVVNEPLEVLDTTVNVTSLLLGVPHTIVFVDNVAEFDLFKYGPVMEKHPAYPRKTNVSFVEVVNNEEMKYRVWERGAGLTLACGTGACSALVAAVLNNKTGRKAKIHLPGGDLVIEWAENDHVYMTGPAKASFSGEVKDESLIIY